MFEWASPWAFIGLVPVLLLPLQARVTGVNRLAITTSGGSRPWTLRILLARARPLLRILGLILAVTALARPRLSHRSTVVTSDGLDIILAVDTSGSMRADFGSGLATVTRLEVAKGVLAEFIESRPNDRIGVVVFGEEAFTHVPLTLDHDTLADVLDNVQIGIAGENRTAIGSAVAVSAKRLKELDAPSKIVILLTDGRNNSGRYTPEDAARMAGALQIKVYTVGIGGTRSWFRGGADGLDERTLRAIASQTDGEYFRADSASTLDQIYDTIDQLEPSPAEVEELIDHEELFRWPLFPSLGLLALHALLAATWLRRGP